MKLFNAEGNEILPPKPAGELTVVLEVGAQFESFRVYLEFKHQNLNRQLITDSLGVAPDKAWNAGEKHLIGNGKSGRMREDDFGLWRYEITTSNGLDVSLALVQFFDSNNCLEKDWDRLAKAWNGTISIVCETESRNREIALASDALKMVAMRGLQLNVDAYFNGK